MMADPRWLAGAKMEKLKAADPAASVVKHLSYETSKGFDAHRLIDVTLKSNPACAVFFDVFARRPVSGFVMGDEQARSQCGTTLSFKPSHQGIQHECFPVLPRSSSTGGSARKTPAIGAIGDGAGREVADADGHRPSAVFARRDRPQ